MSVAGARRQNVRLVSLEHFQKICGRKQVGFVALRQNKPASSGRMEARRNARLFERRWTRRYLSQRDKFHHTEFTPATRLLKTL